MASYRNIVIQDQGANWRVAYEWTGNAQTGPWTPFEAQFPRDFGELQVDQVQGVMHELAQAVARATGVHD